MLRGPPGSMAQVRPPFWVWHLWRAPPWTPPHAQGGRGTSATRRSMHRPLGGEGQPAGWGAAVRLGAQRLLLLPAALPQALPATLGSCVQALPSPGQAAEKQARVWRSGPGAVPQHRGLASSGDPALRPRPTCLAARLPGTPGPPGPTALLLRESPAVPRGQLMQSGCPWHWPWGQNSGFEGFVL